jgi:hypothetical protein
MGWRHSEDCLLSDKKAQNCMSKLSKEGIVTLNESLVRAQ